MDHFKRSLLNHFSMQPLDRQAHLRADEQWLASQINSADSCFYALHSDKLITVDNQPLRLNSDQYSSLNSSDLMPLFLGTKNAGTEKSAQAKLQTTFAINVDPLEKIQSLFPQAQVQSLRDMADSTPMNTASELAYALLMNRWVTRTRFCKRCGHGYVCLQGGHVLKCSSLSCGHIEFPRINPAVIMRVTCGDKILLARQPNWPENRYSVLAGFVETGETLENAVKREIKEESGIDVDEIYYHSSQPWPFPNSLMIGYCAQTSDMTLDIEKDDLETAIWLNADELIEQMNTRRVILSPPISISHRLIEDWFMQQTGRSIKEWQNIKPEHIVHENE